MEHLFVSDVTADSFRLTWTANEDLFDRFVIKIRDSKRLAHPQEHSVRGDQRTKVITGLMGGTEYEIELYGATLDRRSQPITGVVQTGILKNCKVCSLMLTTKLSEFSVRHSTSENSTQCPTNHVYSSGFFETSRPSKNVLLGKTLCFHILTYNTYNFYIAFLLSAQIHLLFVRPQHSQRTSLL